MLEREILEIAAQEQRSIGQELHDGTQQQLNGLGLLAQTLVESLDRISDKMAANDRSFPPTAGLLIDRIAALRTMAARISDGIDNAAREVHLLSRGLIPVEVDARGLMAALGELAGSLDQLDQTTCVFACDQPVEVADNFTATHIYRIAQEAVTNALKHSSADRIEMSLEEADGCIKLKVRDNGIGIDPRRSDRLGMGLRIMGYRSKLIGATLEIEPADGGGTVVSCTVPQE
jgi:two-component system CheB/CheR fusion protein